MEGNIIFLDVIVCENMIGGLVFLEKEVYKYFLEILFIDKYIGFLNVVVDWIVLL